MSEWSEFQAALDYIYSFVDYSVKRRYRYSEEAFDLDRVRRLLSALGDPQDRFPSVHIAGTKGKGSVAALMESALRHNGYRTGLYTSPHLIQFTERIRVGGENIQPQDVVDLVARLKPHVRQQPGITTYEIITAMGFMYFADAEVDCAVVEVGLGGRLDATNVLMPLVSVITSLSYDHMHLLGDSLSDIAREKAGIIKPGVPVVVAPQQYEAGLVVREVAAAMGAPLIQVGRDWMFSPAARDLGNQSMVIWSAEERAHVEAYVESGGKQEWAPTRLEIPLLGYHQVVNSAVAYAALQSIKSGGLSISETAIREGFRDTRWPGRFQVLSRSPYIVVDSAHNRDSALKLRIALDDYFPGQPVTLIFGASADKDIPGMLAELMPRVSRLIVTQAEHPRAEEAEKLAEIAHRYALRVESRVPVAAALEHALQRAGPDEVILAAGSVFVAGEVLEAWQLRSADLRQTAK
jgi:dihydrofolate synthase/folylpolyglutamate synthase